MQIDFIDLKQRYLDEKKELLNIFDRVLKKGSLVLTKGGRKF